MSTVNCLPSRHVVDRKVDKASSCSLDLYRSQCRMGALPHRLSPRRLSSCCVQLGSDDPRWTLQERCQAKYLSCKFCMDNSLRFQPLVPPAIPRMETAYAARRESWPELHVCARNLVNLLFFFYSFPSLLSPLMILPPTILQVNSTRTQRYSCQHNQDNLRRQSQL